MKMKVRYTILASIMVLIFPISCLKKIALNSLGAFENNVSFRYITNGEKEIIFFPMHHIGKPIFYNDVKQNIDSLMKKGYIVYYELVTNKGIKTKQQQDTLLRKIRKFTGIDFMAANKTGGYVDTNKNELMGTKTRFISKYKLINQPADLLSTFDTLKLKNIDANFLELLNACEKKYGVIQLNEYDFATNFGQKYKNEKNEKMKKYFLTEYRNNLIADTLLADTNHNNIILIYGTEHFDGILNNLKLADKNYKELKKIK